MKLKPIKSAENTPIPFAVFGTWEVWPDGALKSPTSTRAGNPTEFTIHPRMLRQPDLMLNLFASQTIEDWNYFIQAFFCACEVAGIKQIENFQTGFE